MDIKTAMALRNYGINPQSGTITEKKQNSAGFDKNFQLEGLSLDKTDKAGQKQDFSAVMKNIAAESIGTLKQAEQTAIDGLNNKTDVQSVVEAMAQAEMTVKSATAIRDKVVEAYQEILRMPM
ncbi:MAG: flagellar hook-basal body complex protein FliE [Pseudomonadota bacterium]